MCSNTRLCCISRFGPTLGMNALPNFFPSPCLHTVWLYFRRRLFSTLHLEFADLVLTYPGSRCRKSHGMNFGSNLVQCNRLTQSDLFHVYCAKRIVSLEIAGISLTIESVNWYQGALDNHSLSSLCQSTLAFWPSVARSWTSSGLMISCRKRSCCRSSRCLSVGPGYVR